MEFPTLITLLPHIMNGFYVITSVRGFKERRYIVKRPTIVRDDGLIEANPSVDAPVTLTRLILVKGPLTEKEIVYGITLLEVIACILAIVSSIVTYFTVVG